MRQVAKKGLLTAMATGSVLASTAGYAYASGADAHGAAANSPGVGSGNAIQAPVDIPVNACGNTINVIGLLNPAYGNSCANASGGGGGAQGGSGSTHTGSGSSASGTTSNSPGVASGNNVQAPVAVPVDACGNSVNVVGVGNPAFGNDCANHGTSAHHPPVTPPSTPPGDDCPPEHHGDHNPPPADTPPSSTGTDRTGGPGVDQAAVSTPVTPAVSTPTTPVAEAANGRLASTGVSGLEVLAPAGALLMLGGGVLYRRSKALAGR